MVALTYRLVEVGKETDGDPAKLRSELAPYWPVTVAYVKHATGVDLAGRIVQAQGGAKLSAGTHWDGAAVDLRTRGLPSVQIAAVVAALRDLGWAAWYRDWTGNQHIHAAAHLGWTVLTGCLYQVRAYKAGYNGLDTQGRGGKDPHPRPDTIRTIQQGAIWAARQMLTDIERYLEDMDEKKLRQIIREEAAAAVKADRERPAIPGHKEEWGSTPNDLVPRTAYRVNALVAKVDQLAATVAKLVKG